MACSKVRLGRRASGERAQLPLWWILDRSGRCTDQPLPSTFTCDIVPGGGVEEEKKEGKVEGFAEEALRCPHRAWLLCSSISQRALPASRERLNEARAV